MTKNMFTDYRKPVRPDYPAQQLSDTRPRSEGMKKAILGDINKKLVVVSEVSERYVKRRC